MKVEVVSPGDLGPSEIEAWRAFQLRDRALSSPFLSPEFALATARARPETRVAVLSDGREVTGFFAFERTGRNAGTALALGLSDVQAVVAPPSAALDLAHLARECGLKLWRFDHLVADQRRWLAPRLARVAPEVSPALDLSAGWEAYYGERRRTSRSTFQGTERKQRKLSRERGRVRLELDATDHGLLDRVIAWKSAQYVRTGRRDRFADARNRSLVHELLDCRAPGCEGRLTVLWAGDTPVAGHFGLAAPSQLAWWFPAYDPAFGAYSPGLVLVIEIARALAAAGIPLLDFGKGDEPYKERLANTEIALLSGWVAADRRSARAEAARRWPAERLTRFVLERPRLRGWARDGLSRAGRVRERARGLRR